MAEIGILNKQHPLYQEDLKRICETKDLASLYNKRFLITGATGLIGVCLIDALMKANAEGANITIYALSTSTLWSTMPVCRSLICPLWMSSSP